MRQLNIQVHGGIGFTWEHDAHLYLRRADGGRGARRRRTGRGRSHRPGARRGSGGPARRPAARGRADPGRGPAVRRPGARRSTATAAQQALVDTGYAMPHWPKPWGRDAGPIEQLVIEQEFGSGRHQAARLRHHRLGDPYPDPARDPGPGAALGAAGARPGAHLVPAVQRAGRGLGRGGHQDQGCPKVDGGWLVNGQKVWTSGAHVAGRGLATVRTNPDAPKHEGITTMVIDMQARGRDRAAAEDDDRALRVQRGLLRRRLRAGRRRGRADRRRLDRRPRDARQRERQHRRRRRAAWRCRSTRYLAPFDAHPARLPAGAGRVGRHIARTAGGRAR